MNTNQRMAMHVLWMGTKGGMAHSSDGPNVWAACKTLRFIIIRAVDLHERRISRWMLSAYTQGAQLSQRDRATHSVSRSIVKYCTAVRKITFERLAVL